MQHLVDLKLPLQKSKYLYKIKDVTFYTMSDGATIDHFLTNDSYQYILAGSIIFPCSPNEQTNGLIIDKTEF